jgi:shikimate kinase
MAPKPVVVLIGPPASGKTKIGKRVAAQLGVAHLDTDRMVVEQHGPIPEIFSTRGEDAFRAWERDAVTTALATDSVVSLGGGAVIHDDTHRDLAHHTVIALTIRPDAVAHRLDNDKRPLLTDGLASWESLVKKRQPLYDRVARHTIDVSHRDPDDVAHEIVSWLADNETDSQ